MRITHILKDGSRHDDISGKVVKHEEALGTYQLIGNINKRFEFERLKGNNV